MKVASRDLQILFDVGVVGTHSDRELLERFAARREDAAFEALVRRHGPMVWGVCRRVLRNPHDAEDAFQATFLVLARKAASIAHRELVGNWLYAVSFRTARKARAMTSKRQARESQVTDQPEPATGSVERQDDLLSLLDQELIRLPEKYRIPIVLCDLQGKTHQEVASQLGVPIGTVSSRLSRARDMLAKRLSQKGVNLSVGSLAILLAQAATSASVPESLVLSTVQAASLFAAGGAVTAGMVSAEVSVLSREVLKMMLLFKIKIGMALMLGFLIIAAGGTGLAYWTQVAKEKTGVAKQGKQAGSQQVQVKGDLSPPQLQQPVLAGSGGSTFGGGPDEPLYIRDGNLFYVISPVGDRFSVYNAATNKASTIRLPGTKDSPLKVSYVKGSTGLMPLRLDGPRITKLYVFSIEDWKWYVQDLKEPVSGKIEPILGGSVLAYKQGRDVYAFSTKKKGWDVLELPEDAPRDTRPTVMTDSVVVEYDGHVHEFSGQTGEWKHHDFRALIDAAIESAEEGTSPDEEKKN